MVMEFDGLASTRWTSNSARPFARAPGAGGGLASTRWTTNTPWPFARSPGAGTSGISGFSATPATIQGDDIQVLAKKWDFEVVRNAPVIGAPNQIPIMFVQLRFTDRGMISSAAQLDAQILPPLRSAGFKTSKATSFNAVPVSWKITTVTGTALYAPVVDAPADLAGIRYSGNAVTLPWTGADPKQLSALPSNMYVYSFAVTSKNDSMTDAEGAQVLSLVRAWLQGQSAKAYATGKATLMSGDKSLFVTPITPVAAGAFGLILVVAWNMLSPHIKGAPGWG